MGVRQGPGLDGLLRAGENESLRFGGFGPEMTGQRLDDEAENDVYGRICV